MKKRSILLVLVMAMVMALFIGCSGGDSTDGETDATTEAAKETEATGDETEEATGEEGTALKIAIVSSPSGVDDGSFNEDNYNGILAFIDENPDATVQAVREPSGDPTASVQAVADIVADLLEFHLLQ